MMKIKTTILLAFCVCMPTGVLAQKKALDHSVYDTWNAIDKIQYSSDGEYLIYEVNPQEGDGKLVVRRQSDGRELVIPRGYDAVVAKDGQTVCLKIKTPYAKIREARNKKVKKDKMPKDSLAILQLVNWNLVKLERIKSFKTGEDNQHFVAYVQDASEHKVSAKKEKMKDGKKVSAKKTNKDGDVLVAYNVKTGCKTFIKNVSSYAVNADASSLCVLVNPDNKNKKLKSSAILYNTQYMSSSLLSKGKSYYGHAQFSADGKQLVFLASTDTTTTGNKHCSLFYVNRGKVHEIIPQDYRKNLPDGWSLNENSMPVFSQIGKRILVGVAPCLSPKDTTIIEAETAQLDVWNYKDYQIQPQQKVELEKNKKKVYTAVVNLDSQKGDKSAKEAYEVIPLTTNMWDQVTLMDEGNGEWALSQDRAKYYIQSQWDFDKYTDLSLVNLSTGERKMIAQKVNTEAEPSPDGKYVIWYDYDTHDYYSYNIQNGKTVNLTKQVGVNFFDEENDRPKQPLPYCLHPMWEQNDKSVLINDRYDVWKFNPDGSSYENLTLGQGRAGKIQLRLKSVVKQPKRKTQFWKSKEAVADGDKLYMTAFEETTKKNGIASVSMGNPESFLVNVLDTFSYTDVCKAENKDVMAYQKGNFAQSYNVYASDGNLQGERCLSDINPQQKEYRWGTVRLVHWNAYDGTPLDGLLYVPDQMEADKKYPMIVYFYEKRSKTLYNYIEPTPSRSTINIPFFCSRGYVVFVPDIVYKTGHPGESAYNCIVSGTKSMCQQFAFIDSTKMALQGQSWGGYQTAYLITRTHLYAAAGAGAPVSNMTSAYGGIRWGEGICRQMQYEHDQSRIGTTLWSKGGLDLYIENSPLFKADQVTTPLLITHNDNDGAVPWYQGIEYFMALRRLGKKVWMLEYNKEQHNLVERRNRKDLSIRLQQFFDFYLKGAPEPAWMKYGVPATLKGQYLGTELCH